MVSIRLSAILGGYALLERGTSLFLDDVSTRVVCAVCPHASGPPNSLPIQADIISHY